MARLADAETDPDGSPVAAPAEVVDFDAAYARWFHPCCRWLRAMGVPESELDDVAQDTFIVAQRRFDRFDGRPESLAPWLYAIAWRVASDHRRTRWFRYLFRRREAMDEQWIDPGPGADPSALVHRREAERLVARVLDGMSPKLRTAFALYELQDHSIEEIARLQGIPAKTVQSRLRLAREQFAARIRRLVGREDAR